ncbi:MAG: Calx-beta domain-containing protein [Planctomycetales bacterium]
MAEVLEARALLSTTTPSNVVYPTIRYMIPPGEVAPLATASPQGFTPAQMRRAYGFDQISFNNGTIPGDGSGMTVAIVNAYHNPNIASDLRAFNQQFGLPDIVFTQVDQTGGTNFPATNGGWAGEIALDVQWVHAMAPRANILLVEANDATDTNMMIAVNYARNQPGVSVVSMSFGRGESFRDRSFDSRFTTPAGHVGITFVASSGDDGSPVNWPSSSANVVAIGGTALSADASGNWTGEVGWSGSGGGISAFVNQPNYQKGVVTQSTTRRTTPDVSMNASPATGVPVYDTFNNSVSQPWSIVGGTSASAPEWAGLLAIVNQGRAINGLNSLEGNTQTLPLLYSMAASNFRDIVTGTSIGAPNYSAGPGYDLVTGRGTPIANLVVNELVGSPPRLSFNRANLNESGGTITLTATLAGTPATGVSTTVALAFSGTAQLGTDYTASASQIVIPAGQTSASITLTGLTDSLFEGPETILVRVASGAGTAPAPISTTILDSDAPPTVSLSLNNDTLDEDGGTTTVTATLSKVTAINTTVNLAFSGTSVQGTGYAVSSSQIFIPAGQTSGTMTLTGVLDDVYAVDNTIVVDIDTVINGTESGTQQVTATIDDGDAPPEVLLLASPLSIPEYLGKSAITAKLSRLSGLSTTVAFNFSGTAVQGTDYTLSGSQIVVPPMQKTGSIFLLGEPDGLFGLNRTAIIDVATVTNGVESEPQQVTVTIQDGEPPPPVTLSIAPDTLSENGGTAVVTATLAKVWNEAATINLTFSGTATFGSDYTAPSQIVIPAGQLSASITLTGVDDNADELVETAVVDILSTVNARETTPQQVAVAITDTDPPTSQVNPLPAITPPSNFSVSWSASIAAVRYDVFMSDNGGPFVPLVTNTTQTSAFVAGQLDHTYAFYSVATDLDGQQQTFPTAAQATTYIDKLKAFPRTTLLEGLYLVGDQPAQVLRNGNQLTLVRPDASRSTGTVANDTAVNAVDWNLTATFDATRGTLTFSDNSVWQKVRELAGRWLTSALKETGIKQLGTTLTFINASGGTSAGRFLNGSEVIASDWGNLVGKLSAGGMRISWSNGAVWDLIPSIGGAWANSTAAPTQVQQLGNSLLFVDRVGGKSPGSFLGPDTVIATGWNVTGTFSGKSIKWSNGTTWTFQTLGGSVPNLGGLWDVSGQDSRILQTDTQMTLVNRNGGTSAARFLSSTVLVADGWGMQGIISGNTITWSNSIYGAVWTRLPSVGGPHVDQAARETGVNQLERALTLTDDQGRVSRGTIVNPTRMVETDGLLRGATITGANLLFDNGGPVWAAVGDLRGDWQLTVGGAPTYVAQSGASVLLMNELGGSLRGTFLNPSQLQVTPLGVANPQPVIVTVGTNQTLDFGNGVVWKKTPMNALDAVFADQNLWPSL